MANNMDRTSNDAWIPEIVANEALGYLGAYLQLGATVAKDSDLTPVKYGKTINIPKRGTVTAQQKGENSDTAKEKPTATEVSITFDQHWYVKFSEEDYTAAVQVGSALPGYVQDGVMVLAEKIEGRLTTHFSSFDNIDFTSGGSDTALKALGRVRARMVKNKVPRLARKYGYISPEFSRLLGDENAFTDPKLIPNQQALTEGTVGRARSFDLFEGQLVPTSGSPAWDQNFFYTSNALVLGTRPLRQPRASLGVEATSVMSEAGLALRLVSYYDAVEMAEVNQIDVLFGTAVYDVRQGFVLESK